MNDFISSNKYNDINFIINHFSNNICYIHNKEYCSYCKSCLKDICQFCINSHNNHELIIYQNIIPKNEEIKLLLDSIKKYNNDYNILINEIYKWKREIENMIINLEDLMKSNRILENINFILNYNHFKLNYNSILKFREIYSNIIGPSNRKNNNQILNNMTKGYNINEKFDSENKMGLFDYDNYSMMKCCLDKIKDKKNDIITFLNKSNLIVKILYDISICFQNENNLYYCKKMYNKNNIFSLSAENLFAKNININNINQYNDDKIETKNIIYKLKDFSLNKKNSKNKNTGENISNIYLNKTKIGNIFLEQNNLELKLSNNQSKFLYKKSISQTPKNKQKIFFTKLNSSFNTSNRNIYYKKKSFSKKKNEEKKTIIYKINNENKKYINKYSPNIKGYNKKYTNKKQLEKTYIHKKFDDININNNKQINQMNTKEKIKIITFSPKITSSDNKKETNYLTEQDDNNFNLSCDNTLNNTFSETIKKKLNFDLCNTNTNIFTSLKKKLFEKPYNKKNIKFQINERKYYNINTYDSSKIKINDNHNFKLIKNSVNKKYIIDINKPLFIGLDLNNNNCKICLINENEKNNKKIELFCFKENSYSIPTLLSFNEKKNEIEIGYQALDNLILNPSRTVFNIMKFFGKNYNEVKFNQNLYPHKIFYIDNIYSRPYIKMDFENKKEKKIYFEDLFTIYMEKLFQIFFNEIEMKDKKCNINPIQIILVVGIPDSFNYFQRKILEKLFQTQIFPENIEITNNDSDNKQEDLSLRISKSCISLSAHSSKKRTKKKLYGGYKISLKEIRIINNSSIANFCLKTYNDIPRNALLINMNGDSIDISLSSIYEEKGNEKNEIKHIYDIKKEKYIKRGGEDFIDNYIEQNLKINKNNKKESINEINIRQIFYLRKKCYDIIPNINKNNEKNESDEYCIIKKELIKSLNDVYNQIIISIKKMIINEKINESNIKSLILIGSLSRTDSFIRMLKKLFKYNKYIITQLSNIEAINNYIGDDFDEIFDDYYVAAGAAIQSYNLDSTNSKYFLKDICPISFGIETLDGMMEFVIEKGEKIPIKNQKFIKIKKNNESKNEKYLEINIYEGENKEVNKNKLISCVNIDKKNFKNEKICNNYIELLIQLEIEQFFNLRVFVLDPKSLKRRFECIINFDVFKR